MDIHEFMHTSKNDGGELFYECAVNSMGGPEAFRKYIPFTEDELRRSFAADEHFNTSITHIRKWDQATGITVPNGSRLPPVATGGGIWPVLSANGITWMSQSQAVCLLKAAARLLIGKGVTLNV